MILYGNKFLDRFLMAHWDNWPEELAMRMLDWGIAAFICQHYCKYIRLSLVQYKYYDGS